MDKEIIKLLEQEFELSIDSPGVWSMEYMGRSDTEKSYIKIKDGMSKDATASTLLHEVIHVMLDICGVEKSRDEHFVNNLALGMMSFIRNNKQLIDKYIMPKGAKK